MGIEVQSLKLLLLAQRLGADFGKTLTIGRQDVLVSSVEIVKIFRRFGDQISESDANFLSGEDNRFSSGIFERLGATQIDAMDISTFEGATIAQDLNQPINTDNRGRFSVVFDGGTLEHVFNCSTAMRNYMLLPRVGGHLIIAVPANNEMGHGFYQFSPEFFFRTLTPDNGYRINGIFIAPIFHDLPWLAVRDPQIVGGRVGYNRPGRSRYVFAIAERVADVEPFATAPMQSDYVAAWDEPSQDTPRGHRPYAGSAWRRKLVSTMPRGVINALLFARTLSRRPDPRLFAAFAPGEEPLPSIYTGSSS